MDRYPNTDDIKRMLEQAGALPHRYQSELKPLEKRMFSKKCPYHYRLELVGPSNPQSLEVLHTLVKEHNIPGVQRVVGTLHGLDMLSDSEIRDLVKYSREWGIEFIATPITPPKEVESANTPEGAFFGVQMTPDTLKEYLEQVVRGVRFGLRWFLVWDQGALHAAKCLQFGKTSRKLPRDVQFKVSIFAGVASPYGIKMWENNGASSINPRALEKISHFEMLRMVSDIPLDVHITTLDSMGGLNRIHEAHKIIEATAPVNVKFESGASVADLKDEKKLKKIVFPKMIRDVQRFLAHMKEYPDLTMSP